MDRKELIKKLNEEKGDWVGEGTDYASGVLHGLDKVLQMIDYESQIDKMEKLYDGTKADLAKLLGEIVALRKKIDSEKPDLDN